MKIRRNRYVETNLKPYRKCLAQIRALDLPDLTDDEIRRRSALLRVAAQEGNPGGEALNGRLNRLLPEAWALVCAAVRQAFGWTVFDCQLLAAAAMNAGRIIELDTGEGKTLAAVFVAYLRALSGNSVHVLTFNDYLASRDAAWMEPVYTRLGIRVATIRQSMSAPERRQAYQADVVYLTAKEAGFDYLRGFLATSPAELVQRPFYFAIIDEADSIMIDEARIPLVLAGGQDGPGAIDPALFRLVKDMQVNQHYRLDEYAEHILITESGAAWLERHLNIANLYDPDNIETLTRVRLILQAIALLRRDVDYIVRQGSIELVDEFTGRVIQNRQWPDGLHEAVEIKEGLSGRSRGRILNRITLWDFLSLYPGICGMTGTAWSAAAEFCHFYGVRVTRVPPHVPCRRIDQPDLIYCLRADKETAIVDEVARRHVAGQPVLVGTANVEESERLSAMVRARGLTCEVLNARHDDVEAAIIARSGRRAAITISTNMAGRGVDIQLEDTAAGGLCVIGTSRQRSERIDNQLRGRAGRQGDPGESRFFVSLQDDLIERYHIRAILPAQYQTLSGCSPQPVADPGVTLAVEHTQRVVEGQLYQQRQALGRYSLLVEEQRRLIHTLHEDVLTGRKTLGIWQTEAPGQTAALVQQTSASELQQAEQKAGAMLLSRGWADYLELVDQLMDHVSLMRSGPSDPFTTFNKQIIEAYAHFLDIFEADMIELAGRLTGREGRINLEDAGVCHPPSTRTYLIDDGSDTLDQILGISNLVAAAANPAGFLMALAAARLQRRREN